jgi:Phage-related minor tail protein/Transposase DDE domain
MADNFGLKIGVEGEREFKKSLREINQSFRVLGSEMKLVTSEFDRNDKSIKAITARNAVLNKEIDAQKEKISTLEKALANAAESFGENDRRTLSWQTQLNNANAELNNLERELKDLQEEVKNLNREKVEKLVNGLKTAGEIAGKVLVAGLKAAAAAMAAIGTGAVASGKFIKDSLNVYGEYEDAMKQVQATMGLTGEEGEEAFNKLSQAAKDAGASTRFSAYESAEALNYLALAGYDTEQAIGELPGVLTLAAAGDMDLARASDLVTYSMAALGLEIADMDLYMDKMAKTSQKSNTDVQQLGEGILVAGATMKNAGQDLAYVTAATVPGHRILMERIERVQQRVGYSPKEIVLDAGYYNARLARELEKKGILAYMSYRRFHRKEHPDCRSVKFQQVTDDVYACPCGVKFTYSTSTSSGYHEYKPAVKGSCVGCPAAKGAKDRVFRVSVHQDIYERMRKQRLSMRGKVLRSVRPSTIERSFAESKELHGLRFTRYRGVQQKEF